MNKYLCKVKEVFQLTGRLVVVSDTQLIHLVVVENRWSSLHDTHSRGYRDVEHTRTVNRVGLRISVSILC